MAARCLALGIRFAASVDMAGHANRRSVWQARGFFGTNSLYPKAIFDF